MKVYEIDFKGVKTYSGFYQRIIKSMNFPSWCGENPAAIWDMMSTHIEIPAVIYVRNMKGLPSDFQEEKDFLIKIINRARERYKKLKRHVEIIIED